MKVHSDIYPLVLENLGSGALLIEDHLIFYANKKALELLVTTCTFAYYT